MDEDPVNQIAQAIMVAYDAGQAQLHQQALAFLQNTLKDNNESWRVGLALFVDSNTDGSRKHPLQVRFYGLRVLEDFLDSRFEPLDDTTFKTIQRALLSYIQSEYVLGAAEANAPYIRNKFSHTLTLFFLCTYLNQWPTFFADLFTLIRTEQPQTSQAPEFNPHISLLLFHLVTEISGEVADQMLKSARAFNPVRHARDGRVRDTVRDRDAAPINEAVLTIVADAAAKMARIRKGELDMSLDILTEVVDWGIRSFGSYVGWIDINLTVTPTTVPLLFQLIADPSLPIRLATSAAFLRMISKGLKEPGDKLQLFRVLSLGQVLEALEEKTRLQQIARGDDTDEGEESYREALGRLLNVYGLELAKLVDDNNAPEDVKVGASAMLLEVRPPLLHFLADQYDDTTSTIFPLLSHMLGSLKKTKRSEPEKITDDTRAFLSTAVEAILQKMKWDDEADFDDIDEDDKHAFETLRKGDLRVNLDSILAIDQDLVINAARSLIMATLKAFEAGTTLKWTEAELAIYLVYIFGEMNKSGGKGRAAFCFSPPVAKEQRKVTDYSEYQLTPHGEMLYELVRSGICNYPHNAVAMQFFETCVRYCDFFKVRKDCIMPLLEAMVGSSGIHHPDSNVRSRVDYLFYKFIKEDRNEIPIELVDTLLNGIRDVLNIEVVLPELDNPAEQDLLTEAVNNAGVFDSQLYLYEVTGLVISLHFKNSEHCRALLTSIVQPLLDDLQVSLQSIRGPQDVVHIVKIHHIIMALGNVAKGYPDMPSPLPPDYIMPPIVIFRQIAQAILVSLEAMKSFKVVRDAARFAFVRLVATAGSQVTDFLPSLMSNLLAHFEPTELVDFMNFIILMMHRLQAEMFSVLEQLVPPVHSRIMEFLARPITGTDDRVSHQDTKKGYLNFLNAIMSNKLHGVFLTDGNEPRLVPLLGSVLQIAEDVSDTPAQKLAISFLCKCVLTWGQTTMTPNGTDGVTPANASLPGFEQFIYERLVPLVFSIPANPSFNVKDGQAIVIMHECATLLQTITRARGEEACQFVGTVFLPQQGCPTETAIEFASKMRVLDPKTFRKYFTDFVRTLRSG